MKKNITINLFGALYAIDEDAYELLKKYEENMRAYFSRKEGGAEIADDIENRVAELFAELKAAGVEAVTIEHVEDIIRRIGNPEEMDDDMADTAETAAEPGVEDAGHEVRGDVWERMRRWWNGRKLYRDSEDVMVGGVMSGLCRCFGGSDPLPWRIGMVLLTICSFYTFAIIYLVLWAFLPQARTAEDKLRMQGRPVNPGTINEELMRNVNRGERSYVGTQTAQSARGCLSTLLSLVLFCAKLLVLVTLGLFFFMLLGCLAVVLFGVFNGIGTLVDINVVDGWAVTVLQAVPGIGWKLTALCLSGLIVLGIPMGVLINRLLHRSTPGPASAARRFTLVAVWLTALVVTIVVSVFLVLGIQSEERRIEREHNTVNGIYMSQYNRSILQENGWNLLQYENCDERHSFYYSQTFVPGENWRYMDVRKRLGDRAMKFQVERRVDMPAGKYCVEALGWANGNGCCLYLKSGDAKEERPTVGEVPVGIDLKGNVARMTLAEGRSAACFTNVPDSATWEEVKRNAGEWNLVRTDTLRHAGGVLKYGVSNDVKVTSRPWNGTHLKVAAVQLRRVGDL